MQDAHLKLPDESHAPRLSVDRVQEVLAERWALTGAEVRELGSYQDQVFEVALPGVRYAFKVAHAAADRGVLEMEHAVLHHLRSRLRDLMVPSPVADRAGEELIAVDGHLSRLLTWAEGVPLADGGFIDEARAANMGAAAGQLSAALASFAHPAAHRAIQWDVRQAAALASLVRPQLTPDEWHQQQLALTLLASVDTAALPVQVASTDVTANNLLGSLAADGTFTPRSLVDFGDTVATWRLADAVGAAHGAAFGDPERALPLALAALAAFHQQCPLTEPELAAFWPVMAARAALCAASAAWQERGAPRASATSAEYVHHFVAGDQATLAAILSVEPALAHAAAREACGLAPAPTVALATQSLRGLAPRPLLPDLADRPLVPLPLDVASPLLRAGQWDEPAALASVVAQAAGEGVAVGRWGESRLVGVGRPAAEAPRTLHLGADLIAPAGTRVAAPVGLRVRTLSGQTAVLELTSLPQAAPLLLRLTGLSAAVGVGAQVEAGELLGTIAPPASGALLPARLHVQLVSAPGLPGTGHAEQRAAWLAICPDPSPLLGVDVAAPEPRPAAQERARREAVVARAQELYFQRPPEMVRGWRHHLFDATGRPYVDMVNNVAAVGHSHPAVAAAATEQLHLLNTNSRFLYGAIADYAEAITETLPPELSSVFFVNSGSEALDLAFRIARIATGRRSLLAVRGAYHGWTGAVMEACTHPYDNPGWQSTIPEWIHPVAQPNPFRGEFGAEAGPYVDSVREQLATAEAQGGAAAFVAEPMLGNAGAVSPPAGYLQQAYALVREAGGLCIADEVQVGYGRTGETFWSFEFEGVVPDIVAAAKSVGNGHPVGFVACRPELAEAVERQAAFFSSPGGGPVSCRVGLAVLRVIQRERLRENAATVGAALKQQLTALGEEHELIAGVNGRGLYLGVDLARDRDTLEPASEEAYAICERLRRFGVILQPTGEHSNVLKIKPPLCFSQADADYVVAALDRVLRERVTSL